MNRKNRRFPFFNDSDDFGFGFDFERMWSEMDAMISKAREDPEYQSGKPIYYGYSVEIGPDGVPHVREYGNVKPGQGDRMVKRIGQESDRNCSSPTESPCNCTGTSVPEAVSPEGSEDVIEPYTCTIFDDKKKQLKINAEVPGISKEDIDLELRDDKLILTAKTESKHYRKVIPMEQEISQRSIKANYNNGVLEITMKCKTPRKEKKGKKIDVK